MEFKYSDELPEHDNPTYGLAGNIPLRRHRNGSFEDRGAARAQRDWNRFIGALAGFKGGMAYKYGLMQVAVPECRPERLEVLAYASELGFLYDDSTETLGQQDIERANDNMQAAFTEGVDRGRIDVKDGGLKAMQAILLQEMLAIDRPRAVTAMKVWIEFLQAAAGRQHQRVHQFSTLDEYMQYRVLDVGEMFWFGLVTFGMGLTVPDVEISKLRELTRPCWIVLTLQNDICSYEKEMATARASEACGLVNALWILMKTEGINLEAAKDICRSMISSNVAEYQQTVQRYRGDQRLAIDTRIYLESLLYTMSGDAAWSLIAPRYNAGCGYSAHQLELLKSFQNQTGAATTTFSTASERFANISRSKLA